MRLFVLILLLFTTSATAFSVFHDRVNYAHPSPEDVVHILLKAFSEAVYYKDVNRLASLVALNEQVSPVGIQQLYNVIGGNQLTFRSIRQRSDRHISATVIFTNPFTQVANLFYFEFKRFDTNPLSWKITDMKLMYPGYGVPNNNLFELSDFYQCFV